MEASALALRQEQNYRRHSWLAMADPHNGKRKDKNNSDGNNHPKEKANSTQKKSGALALSLAEHTEQHFKKTYPKSARAQVSYTMGWLGQIEWNQTCTSTFILTPSIAVSSRR